MGKIKLSEDQEAKYKLFRNTANAQDGSVFDECAREGWKACLEANRIEDRAASNNCFNLTHHPT